VRRTARPSFWQSRRKPGTKEVEQNPDGGRLAGAVQPKEFDDLTGRHLQVQVLHCHNAAVLFRKASDGDRRVRHG